MPGHIFSIGWSYPDLVSCFKRTSKGLPIGQLQPWKQETYKLVETVLKDIKLLFYTADIHHIGFDEVLIFVVM